ncbi:DUF6284 family protein [Planosporangium sp. 12N6]|uniref:DUF6284 family protein n=1 Tax=Planosporangium spinosum TaxID=3402278 RepID=UPI003CF7C8DC
MSDEGPTTEDLAAIEREMPLIEAEVELLDAEISILNNGGRLSELDWRRLRRAEARVLREAAALASRSITPRRSAA